VGLRAAEARPPEHKEKPMLTKSRRLALLAVAPLALAGTLAAAQTAPAPQAPGARPTPALFDGHRGGHGHGRFGGGEMLRGLFDEVDADGDGTVTQAELDTFRAAQFSAADTSGDGSVSIDEFATVYFARIRPQMVDAFQAFDDDGDGAVTSAELEERFESAMSRLDRDGDGTLSLQDRGGRGHRDGDDDR
jgi:Ca2+-binding EF-hand superfamily protein